MRFFLVFGFLIFSSNAMATVWIWPWDLEDPGPLREIVIWGSYTPEDEREIEEDEKYYRYWGYLEEGESFKDSSLYVGQGKERFHFSAMMYCHKESRPEKRTAKFFIFDHDLRARLYDEEGILLEDVDFKSFHYQPTRFTWRVQAYIPYHSLAQKLKVVSLEGDEEIVLWEIGVFTLEYLQSERTNFYRNRSNCYHSP